MRKTSHRRTPLRKVKLQKTAKNRKTGGSRKINCSPAVSGKTVNSSTCYTTDVLIKIKDAYNKSHKKSEYIPWSNPQEIWRTLNKRLVNCAKEDCWLSTIKDKQLAKELKDVIFAPEHPPEWIKNPNEWLTDVDISKVMKQYEKKYNNFKFIGPSPIDFDSRVERGDLPWAESGPDSDKVCVWEELCHLSLEKLIKQGKTQIGMIFNLDRYDEPGSHWVSLYLSLGEPLSSYKSKGGNSAISVQWPSSADENGGGKSSSKKEKEGPFVFYFDSTGREAPSEIKTLIERMQDQGKELVHTLDIKSYSNKGQDHQQSNTECGMYSLFFLITMLSSKINGTEDGSVGETKKYFGDEVAEIRGNLRERSSSEFILDFNDKITLFRDATIPDKYVEQYRHKYFNRPE